jgi:hypothetical protein
MGVDVFEAQRILLTMCAAERLLTQRELQQLRRLLQQLQGAAVQLSNGTGTGQLQQQLELGLSRFKLSFKVRSCWHNAELLIRHV